MLAMDQGVVEEWLSEFKVLLYCLCVRVRTQYAVRSLLSFFFFFLRFFFGLFWLY